MNLSVADRAVLRALDDVWRTVRELRVTACPPQSVPARLRVLRAHGLCAYRRTLGGDGRPRGEWAITEAGDRALSEPSGPIQPEARS